ncbi:MAG: aromatic amino acid transport family protein [Gammaproteobacteria bacterium]
MFKNFDAKLMGGVFLIIGTAVGGGMLALPVANGPAGFISSSVFLLLIWALSTVAAFLILEVNLWLPAGSNVISMARHTLGKPGEIIAWSAYLFLLYALLSAYIAGGLDILTGLLALVNIMIPTWLSAVILAGVMATVIYKGIRLADFINRGLIFSKFTVYFLLVILISPYISLNNLQQGDTQYIAGMLMVLVTSFGFSIIVPSLRAYFKSDVKKLRCAILIGSLIPLVLYVVWDAVVIGAISRHGDLGLIAILTSDQPNSNVAAAIAQTLADPLITVFYRFFMSVAILTSFLGVSLCLFDFLADGLHFAKRGKQGLLLLAVTFLPPLLISVFYPGAFIAALSYAGIACVILLLLLPAAMAWSGRYIKQLANGYQLFGGKWMLATVILLSLTLLVIGVGEEI